MTSPAEEARGAAGDGAPATHAQLDDVITQLFATSELLRSRYEQTAAVFDLTTPQARVLSVAAASGRAQRDLAAECACDASNIVGIVDRLEQRDLVVRRSAPDDRRVKLVELTPDGHALHERFRARLHGAVSGLSAVDLAQLDRALTRLARSLDA